MDPLKAVEDFLGDMESWPTYVIYNIFVDESNPSSVKKIAAFMYGNVIPIGSTVKCCNACNGLKSCYVAKSMYEWFFIWDRNPCKSHKAEYY